MFDVKVSDVRRFWPKKFYYQIVANLPYNATEIVGFLKAYELWIFLWKNINGFFLKRTWFFQNR